MQVLAIYLFADIGNVAVDVICKSVRADSTAIIIEVIKFMVHVHAQRVLSCANVEKRCCIWMLCTDDSFSDK